MNVRWVDLACLLTQQRIADYRTACAIKRGAFPYIERVTL